MNLLQLLNIMIASFIFFPTAQYSTLPENTGLISENVFLQTSDGVKISGWFLPAPDHQGVIYFLHGNAGNISDRLFKAEEWIKRSFSVFLLDYRSYGKSEGKITGEKDLYVDAEAGIDWLAREKKVQKSQIVLYGESIGSGPAVELASKASYKALVLEAPFTSLADIAKKHYPMVPSGLLSAFQFDNEEKIRNSKAPLFIIHGTQDEICPFEMGKRLFEAAPEPKELLEIPGGTHNELPFQAGPDFYNRPIQFLSEHSK